MMLHLPRPLRRFGARRCASVGLALVAASCCAHASAAEPPAQAAPEAALPWPELVTLRVQLGLGGGVLGTSLRGGAEVFYWVLPQLAVGGTVSGVAQSAGVLDEGYTSALLGPMLTVRTNPGRLYGYATAAGGLARAEYSNGFDFDENSGEVSLSGFGASTALGVMYRLESHEWGASVVLDTLTRRIPGSGELPYSITFNVVLGIFLRRRPAPQ
jgi:hypothetical protein